ncbi:hypothetical protein ACIP6X_17665 [Streptomyces coeruleorubidus]|jgi:hypothetical protein
MPPDVPQFPAAAALRALTADGRAGQAVGPAEEAIRVLGEAYGEIDDSG